MSIFKNMKWLNEPSIWKQENNVLSVTTDNETDFWRETFYGFVHNSGHFFYKKVTGDFTAELTFEGNYEHLYDQAGLMVRADDQTWAKTGVEFTDGYMHLSAVLTNRFSDWSVVKKTDQCKVQTIRMTKHQQAIRIQYLDENNSWQMLRLGYLALGNECEVGLMCCSPQRVGFEVQFTNFEVKEPIDNKLH